MPPIPRAQYRPPGSRRGASISNLILQRGAIQGRSALASGGIWGNVARDVGDIAGSALQERQQRREADKQSAAVLDLMENWDGDPQTAFEGAVRVLGPKDGPVFANGMNAARKIPDARTREEATALVGPLARALRAAPEGSRPGLWGVLYPMIRDAQLDPDGITGEEWNEERMAPVLDFYAEGLDPQEDEPVGTRTVTITNADGSTEERIVEDKPGQAFKSAAPPATPEPREAEWLLVPGDPTQERNKYTQEVRPSGVQAPVPEEPAAPDPVWGTAKTDAERKRVGVTRTGLAKLAEWKKWAEDNPDLVGPIQGRKTLLAQATGMGATVETGKRKAEMAILRNAVLNALSGAAVNPQEFQRLREQVPEIQDSEEDFYGKIQALDEYFRELLQDYRASPRQTALPIDPSKGTTVDTSSWNLPGVTVVQRP